MDVKSTFLNGPLEEKVCVSQPPGFEIKGRENEVYKLIKALYGLKQVPRAWNKRIDVFSSKQGFGKCSVVYVKAENETDLLLVCLYVDDLLVTGSDTTEIERFKGNMKSEFKMTDLGSLTYFLGIELVYTNKGIVLYQRKYTQEVLKRFHMEHCNEAATPAETNVKLLRRESENQLMALSTNRW